MAGCGVARVMMVECALNDMTERYVIASGMGRRGTGREAHGMQIFGTLTGMMIDYGAGVGGDNPGMTAGLAGGG